LTESDTQEPGQPILETRDLWKIFGENPKSLLNSDLKAATKQEIQDETGLIVGLRDISFHVEKGEIFVLMGLSGSGKSTLIRCLIRLVDPTSGNIIINNTDISTLNKKELLDFRRGSTAMVFQQFGLLPHYTVLDNVAYGLQIRGISRSERYKMAREAVKTVGLEGWEDYLPSSLSGGMQQRVGIARALASDPDIMLLDEPFSGLDPLIRRQMQDELIQLQSELHKTMIFVTHDLQEALKIADRIAIMQDGKIIQIGTPEEIIAEPVDDYVQEFVRDAYPAKVLTAGTIMEDPEPVVYQWQGPKVANTILHRSKRKFIFVVGIDNKVAGLLEHDTLSALLQEKKDSYSSILVKDYETCSPDVTVEELFPIATTNRHPIAVLDEKERLLGYIRNETIIESMIQEEQPENNYV
jgi:glycine betaine/proline transport system ATP-binding protein